MSLEATPFDPGRETLPSLFQKRCHRCPEGAAFFHKEWGIYRAVLWKEYWREVEEIFLGLLELGLNRGDRVAMMGDPCPEFIYSDMAVLSVGAVSLAIHTASTSDETADTLSRTQATFFIAQGRETVDQILLTIDRFPFLRRILVVDRRTMSKDRIPQLIPFADVQDLGKKKKSGGPETFARAIEQCASNDLAIIVLTSGTTGPSKPVMFSHRNLLSFLFSVNEVFPRLQTHGQRAVCHESLAHPLERFVSVYFPLVYDFKPYIGESVESLQETLCEVQPTFFHATPRIWRKLASRITVGLEGSSWLKAMSHRWAMRLGRRYMQKKWSRVPVTPVWRLLRWISDQISFRHIRHQLGFSKLRYALAFGGPLPAAIQDLWHIWGVDLLNCYGRMESAGFVSAQLPGFPRPGDLGKPLSAYRTRVAEDGELLLSGPGIFRGYWGDEKKTEAVIAEGWFSTEDLFESGEDGRLKFVDRKQDAAWTSRGTKIYPTRIQNRIASSPYIDEVVVFAGAQEPLSALIAIDLDAVAEWARKNNVLQTGFTGLVNSPEVRRLIEKEVMKANQDLPDEDRVENIRILTRPLNAGKGEITPDGKIRRQRIYERLRTG